MVLVAPSILSADFLHLAQQIKAIESAGADRIHVDVMDGHFVPNLTMGPMIVAALKQATTLPLDVHLMITNADHSVESYLKAGADMVTVHAEAVTHLDRVVHQIQSHGSKAGVALNPATHENSIRYIADRLDLVLIMSVNPGFGGQKFLAGSLAKISATRALLEKLGNANCDISVDGGITDKTAPGCIAAGANCMVAGNYIFSAPNYAHAIDSLRKI